MIGDLADSATLGGAVALSTSGTRATSGSRLRKSNNKLSGGIQTTMEYEEFDEATVAYILCIFIIYYQVDRVHTQVDRVHTQVDRVHMQVDRVHMQVDRVHMQVDSRLGPAQAQLSYRLR